MEMELITYSDFGEPMLLAQQLIAEMAGKIGVKFELTVVEGSVLVGDSRGRAASSSWGTLTSTCGTTATAVPTPPIFCGAVRGRRCRA